MTKISNQISLYMNLTKIQKLELGLWELIYFVLHLCLLSFLVCTISYTLKLVFFD